jgi:hypothetical protein
MTELTWNCHICGDLRPDALISVRSRMVLLGSVEAQENIRYCNDRPACIEGSKTKSFLTQVSKDLKEAAASIGALKTALRNSGFETPDA